MLRMCKGDLGKAKTMFRDFLAFRLNGEEGVDVVRMLLRVFLDSACVLTSEIFRESLSASKIEGTQ